MSNLLTAKLKKILNFESGLNVIITIGNSLRSDDGVGPYIASKLDSIDNIVVVDAKCNPENFIDQIVNLKPKNILIIDAASFGGETGEIRMIAMNDIPETALSTHAISLKVVASILVEDTGASIGFLGIQPKSVVFGEGLCDKVIAAADLVIGEIKKGVCNA